MHDAKVTKDGQIVESTKKQILTLVQIEGRRQNVTQISKFDWESVKDIVGKGENASFSPFPTMYIFSFSYNVIKKLSSPGSLKVGIVS